MKKIILLCSMFCACVVYAQNPVGNIPKIKTPFQSTKVLKQNPYLQQEGSEQTASQKSGQLHKASKVPKTFVVVPPEGEIRSYKRSGWSYVEDWDGIYRTQQSGMAKVVFAENNEVYLQNVIASINSGKWIKGTLGEDKKTISIAPGEVLENTSVYIYDEVDDEYYEYYGDLKLTMMKVTRGDDFITFTEDTETPITYTIDGDSIVLNNTELNVEVLGVAYSSFTGGAETINGLWASYADCETKYNLFEESIVEVPEDVSLEYYTMASKDIYNDPPVYETSFVQMGMKDNDVYLTSFSNTLPDAVIKGTIKGNTIEFPSKQYIGDAYGYICYLMTSSYELIPNEWGSVDQEHTFTDKFVFNYDASTQTLTPATPQTAMLVNANDAFPYAFNTYNEPTMKLYIDIPATPVDPEILEVTDFYDIEGDWCVSLSINAIGTEGDVLNKEKLFYYVYVNDKIYTFTNEKYGFGEDMTLIPYNFADSENRFIMPSFFGVNVYVQEQVINNIGVQSVYKGGDEEHASNIVWWGTTDVKDIKDNMSSCLDNKKYNLQGQFVNDDYRGMVIMNNKKYLRR
ncbi:MAG: hypothetical protein MJZ20_11250 [Bacteroidaceae bacterium]|nr:hypothetical protein [Bacteroidaceae bacterium]